MSVRELSYLDYGIDDTELKNLLVLIREDDKAQTLFLTACKKVNPSIANDLYYSFTGRVSYEDLVKIKYVPMAKTDFYGYRRKAVATFKKLAKRKRNVYTL